MLLMLFSRESKAQKIDSIFFNLYTDSLKKGTYNYINVDGKFDDGRYLPLTANEIILTASAGSFEGNSLFIDTSFAGKCVTVKVALKNNPAVTKTTTIYIKQVIVHEKLRTVEEILGTPPKNNKLKKKKA